MSEQSDARAPSARDLWRRNGLIWLALSALLALTCGLAYVPLGALNLPVALLIAAAKASLVLVLYMELRQSSALIRLAILIGGLMVLVMFVLTASDVVTRVLNGWRE